MKIKVPIPAGGENNLESKFLRAQSGDPEAGKEYREALEKPTDFIGVTRAAFDQLCDKIDYLESENEGLKRQVEELLGYKNTSIKAHCMGTEFPKREE